MSELAELTEFHALPNLLDALHSRHPPGEEIDVEVVLLLLKHLHASINQFTIT